MKYSDVLALFKGPLSSEIKILAQETLGVSKTKMLTYPQTELSKSQCELLKKRLCELENGRPLQYILGKWEFYSREFWVGEGVLIPREDTMAVVSLALSFLKTKKESVFADLGSGSGCIALTLAMESSAKGFAVERSEKALGYLEKNIAPAADRVSIVSGDMFCLEVLEKLPELDLIVSNPPYITAEEMKELDANVLCEPKEALFGGEDGLSFYRRITEVYKNKLKAGGMLCFEVGFNQADSVIEILKSAGFKDICEKKDINAVRRAVGAFK